MARTFWKGSISFGLVEIPVALRPATDSQERGFTLLDRKDFSPVGFKRYNKATGREVPWERIVHGYEYEPDQYVTLTDEELKGANPKATQTIDIVEFVDHDEIDAMFFETPYYIEPLKQGSKAYALLRDALGKSGKVGVAQVVLRTRAHLAAVTVHENVLVLTLLRYPNEIKAPSEIEKPASTKVSDAEVRMAEKLIDGMTAKWQPEKFKDEYWNDVMALVKKKVKSGAVHEVMEFEKTAEAKPRSEVVDLMPLLKQSIESRGGRAAKTQAREHRAPAARERRKPASKARTHRGRQKSA